MKLTPSIKPAVFGKLVDEHTRCVHYHSEKDIIAIKFKCCDKYYPCFSCHAESEEHPAIAWPKNESYQKAVLCGDCNYEMKIEEYLSSQNQCPSCLASFNPNCSLHYHLYFEE